MQVYTILCTSGTGKTLAAEAVGFETGKPLKVHSANFLRWQLSELFPQLGLTRHGLRLYSYVLNVACLPHSPSRD